MAPLMAEEQVRPLPETCTTPETDTPVALTQFEEMFGRSLPLAWR